MKMNAKKLTLALVALLLALTCVFVACKKEPEKPVDDKPADQPAAPEAVDLTGVAENFKTDYKANYLSLYTDDVATALAALRAEALLKIANAKSVDDAKKIAAEYIAELKAARTLVDEVKDLIAKIAVDGNLKHDNAEDGVALADGKDIALMSAYNARIEDTFVTAAGAQKVVTDAYQAEQLPTVKAIEARLRALKVANLAANAEGGLNDTIDAMLEKTENAIKYRLDGEYEKDGTKLTLRDYEDLLILEAQFDTFVEMHKLVKGTEAYAEILHGTELEKAIKLFDEKTEEHEQIVRARALINAAKELAAAARAAARYVEDEEELVLVNAENPASEANAAAPIYFVAMEVYNSAVGGALPDESIVNPIKIEGLWDETGAIEEPMSVWVSMNDIYADLTEAWTALNTLQIMEVTISGDTGSRNPFRVWIPNARYLSHFILDEDLQAAANAAFEAANAWNELLDLGGNTELEETIANTFYREIIVELLGQYNRSMTAALEGYAEFFALLVEKNYVEEYPVKGVQYDEYLLTTDTQTVTEEGVQQWKANLLNEISKLKRDAKTDYTNDPALIRRLFDTFGADYSDYKAIAEFLNGTKTTYYVDLHENDDGSFTPSVFYQTFAFLWSVDNLAKDPEEARIQVTHQNTMTLEDVLANVNEYFFEGGSEEYDVNDSENYYKLAVKMKAWVEKYIETVPSDVFDLTPFRTVAFDYDEFGRVKLTFADEKLVEAALPQITELNGEKVNATPSEALDITVYSDYNVALAAIAEFERLVAELNATADEVKESVRELFVPGEADYIRDAFEAYKDAMRKYRYCVIDSNNNPFDDEENSLEERLAVIDGYNYDNYSSIFETALLYQERALALYPHKEWDDALATLKAKVAAAQAKYDEMTAAIAAFDAVLAEAREYLAYCEAGHTIGWTNTKTITEEVWVTINTDNGSEMKKVTRTTTVGEEVLLVSDEQLAEAQQWVDVLTKWRFILTDATKFIIENDSRVDFALNEATPDEPADPATLYDFDSEALYDALTSIVCPDNTERYHYATAIRYLPVAEQGEFDLVEYMVNILLDAKQSVKYEIGNPEDSVAVTYVINGDYTVTVVIVDRAKLDEIALKKALDEATKDYNDAKADFVANFKIEGYKAYNDIVKLVNLIADMEEFVHTAIIVGYDAFDEPIYADYDYLNLSVTNEYTENAVDLFSQIFNERIMASYYRAILLTREFAVTVATDAAIKDAKALALADAQADALAEITEDAEQAAQDAAEAALDVEANKQGALHAAWEADGQGLTGDDKDNFIAEKAPGYAQTYKDVNGDAFIADYLAANKDAIVAAYIAEHYDPDSITVTVADVQAYLAENLDDMLADFLADFDAQWFDYSKNELLKVESKTTFTAIADGKAAVVDAWRFINSNWEFVETLLNIYLNNDVEYYDDVIDYLKNPYIYEYEDDVLVLDANFKPTKIYPTPFYPGLD